MTSGRTEDTALLKSNRSAVPGAETEERAVGPHAAARPSPALLLRDRPPCEKHSRQDAATRLTGCPSPLANVPWSQFQFRSEERRVGKECRSRRAPYDYNKCR